MIRAGLAAGFEGLGFRAYRFSSKASGDLILNLKPETLFLTS